MCPAPRWAKETVFFLFLPSCSKRKKRSAPPVTGLCSRHPCASPDRVSSFEVEEEKSAKKRKKDSLAQMAAVLRPLCQGDWFPVKWARRGARLLKNPFFSVRLWPQREGTKICNDEHRVQRRTLRGAQARGGFFRSPRDFFHFWSFPLFSVLVKSRGSTLRL